MKKLKEYIINESINDMISTLEEEIKKVKKDDKINMNVSGNMIIFFGEKNEKQTEFDNKIWFGSKSILEQCPSWKKFHMDKSYLKFFRKVNDEKVPVVYIGSKEDIQNIEKENK